MGVQREITAGQNLSECLAFLRQAVDHLEPFEHVHSPRKFDRRALYPLAAFHWMNGKRNESGAWLEINIITAMHAAAGKESDYSSMLMSSKSLSRECPSDESNAIEIGIRIYAATGYKAVFIPLTKMQSRIKADPAIRAALGLRFVPHFSTVLHAVRSGRLRSDELLEAVRRHTPHLTVPPGL